MSINSEESGQPTMPVTGFFEGERLELNWRYAYRPEYIPLLLDYLGARSGTRILDVGCGSGFLTRLLAQNLDDIRLTGLDADKKMLDPARQMLDRKGLASQVKLRQANAYHLPFPDQTFDLVTSQTLLWILGDPAQGLREQIRVTRSGGTVSAVACFCHSGGLPHYHGRYPLSGNHRIDELDLNLNRIWRRSVRPRLLGVDHGILNLDLLWHFKAAGLQDVQINGHLALASPGDARISVDEAAAYALARQKKELDGLVRIREQYGEELATDGFSLIEFDELITLKQARYEVVQNDPTCVREVMEVFAEPLLIVKGIKPLK